MLKTASTIHFTRAMKASTACTSDLKPARTLVAHARMQVRATATAATSLNGEMTPGQEARGHNGGSGAKGWARAGWVLETQSLSPQLRDLLINYGELSQATYDNLGQDISNQNTYGNALKAPEELLQYLDSDYNLDASAPPADKPGTGKKYQLPAVRSRNWGTEVIELSPLMYALPGKLDSDGVAQKSQEPLFDKFVDWGFNIFTKLLVNLAFKQRPLFKTDAYNGLEATNAFIGYVAFTPPKNPDDEVDVALVWRGTIFKEEWEINFEENKLSEWQKDPEDKIRMIQEADARKQVKRAEATGLYKRVFIPIKNLVLPPEDDSIPDTSKIAVHDGFDDLYNRPIEQPGSGDVKLSPRQIARMWLEQLMEEYNVTTITSTGHSLGGGVATIAAFGTAKLLEDIWKNKKDRHGWKTQQKPKVTLVSWASPRVGNYTFKQEFNKLGIRALRIVNKGDVVPKVPGVIVQFLTGIFESGLWRWKYPSAALDMDSPQVTKFAKRWNEITTRWVRKPRWAYFHVGQVLELDSVEAGKGVVNHGLNPISATRKKHNLELYMYSLSKLGQNNKYGATTRNPLLLNKSDDLLAAKDPVTHKCYPADWWSSIVSAGAPSQHGYSRNNQGRWVFSANAVHAAPRAAVADAPAGAAATAEIVEVGVPAKRKE